MILQTKFRLGLFDNPYVDEARIAEVLNEPKHRQEARNAVQRSVALLRNENSLLPLDKTGKRFKSVAVIGPLGDADIDLIDMWGDLVKPGPTVSILQGIKEKAGSSIRVEYAHGPNISRDIPSMFDSIPMGNMKEQPKQTMAEARKAMDDAVALAKRSDVGVWSSAKST